MSIRHGDGESPDMGAGLTAEQLKYGQFLLDDSTTIGVRFFDDGVTYAAARRLLFHYTVVVGDVFMGGFYRTRWCFETRRQALDAAFDPAWDGHGDPGKGWHRHPDTERRPDRSVDPAMTAYLTACRAEEEAVEWARIGETGAVIYAEPRRIVWLRTGKMNPLGCETHRRASGRRKEVLA